MSSDKNAYFLLFISSTRNLPIIFLRSYCSDVSNGNRGGTNGSNFFFLSVCLLSLCGITTLLSLFHLFMQKGLFFFLFLLSMCVSVISPCSFPCASWAVVQPPLSRPFPQQVLVFFSAIFNKPLPLRLFDAFEWSIFTCILSPILHFTSPHLISHHIPNPIL